MTDFSTLIGDVISDFALFFNSSRLIGTIVPNVTIEEIHQDTLIITDHPVETGATISDHAFKMPVELEMRCGWSNSTAQTEGYVQAVYAELLALQGAREPFNVVTGKRSYSNMLLAGLTITTDAASEYALMSSIHLREVIIVNTSGATVPQSAQASPQQTASDVNNGVQSLQPAPYVNAAGQTVSSPPLNTVLNQFGGPN